MLKLRAGKGMVLDAEDHDTWSAGSFFTNPILTDTDFATFRARVKQRLGDDAEPPPTRRERATPRPPPPG